MWRAATWPKDITEMRKPKTHVPMTKTTTTTYLRALGVGAATLGTGLPACDVKTRDDLETILMYELWGYTKHGTSRYL